MNIVSDHDLLHLFQHDPPLGLLLTSPVNTSAAHTRYATIPTDYAKRTTQDDSRYASRWWPAQHDDS